MDNYKNSDNMNPTPPHEDLSWLLDIIRGSGRKYDVEKIKKAYEVADRLHEGQRRASGEAYISHPIAVAEIVASLGLDTDSICAALLHDTVEDCADKISLEDESKMFGSDVAMLVDGLTKIMDIEFADEEEAALYAEYNDKLIVQRNATMTEYAEEALLSGEEIFICVGAAHIVGQGAIAENLRELGYTVEIVTAES